MKKIIALALLVLVVLSTSACLYPEPSETSVSEDYIVLEATDTYLLVVQIGDDAETIETMQYTAPNLFYPSVQIKAGEIVTIKHNEEILETYPMQFAKIYSMEYSNKETGHTTMVYPD